MYSRSRISFSLFLHYSGQFDCLLKNEINYVKGFF